MKSTHRRKRRVKGVEAQPRRPNRASIPYLTLIPPDSFSDFDELAIWLSSLVHLYARALVKPPVAIGAIERVLAIHALSGVIRFLELRSPSEMLRLLLKALDDVDSGGHPGMFVSESKLRKRPADIAVGQQIKGVLAGLARVKREEGMSRDDAASWIARNIAPEMQRKLSKKPITGRTVREWLDRYGGRHPPDDPGGKAFTVWSRPWGKKLTAQRVRELTHDWSQTIPSRIGR
jgi:hypothetical protein